MKDSRIPNPSSITRTHRNETAEQIEKQIRQRAYELYEARGRGSGYDFDDWLLAEAEVSQKRKVVAA
ncbi:MAG: DUF2934 domain-containing protein [Terracidiphilus sp.]